MLREHCAHARFVWNLAVEQEACWWPGRGQMPGFAGRCRQLTEARAQNPWLAAGAVIVQQQALKDHARAVAGFFAGDAPPPVVAESRDGTRDSGSSHRKPGDVRRLSRHAGEVRIPKAGWVRFRWSRAGARRTRSRSG